MKKFILVLALTLLLAPSAHADIVWAVAGPRTGPVATWGLPGQNAIQLVVDKLNAAGGINNQKIILKTYDDACDPKQAVAVANKIVSSNIHFVLHGTCSAAFLAMMKIYIEEGTVVMNPFASNPKATDEGGPHIFRTIYRDDQAASVVADYIVKYEAKKKLVILNDKSAYGAGIAQGVKDIINKNNVHEISFQSYDAANHDYSALATQIKDMNADDVFIGGYPVEIAMIARQLRNAGSKAQILAGDLSDSDFWKIAGNVGEGALFAFPHDPRKAATAQNAIAEMKKAGLAVDGYSMYAYAAAQVLAQAAAKAGADAGDPAKVADIIHQETFSTVLGPWTFNAKGDVTNIQEVMFRWHDGDYVELNP